MHIHIELASEPHAQQLPKKNINFTTHYIYTHIRTHTYTQFAPLKHTLRVTSKAPNCIAISRDGKFIASMGLNKVIDIWLADTGKLLCCLKTSASRRFSHDSDTLIVMQSSGIPFDTRICLWDFTDLSDRASPSLLQKKLLQNLSMHASDTAKVSPDGQKIANFHHTGYATWLSVSIVKTGLELVRLSVRNDALVIGHIINSCIAWSPDSKCIATVTFQGHIIVFDACTGLEVNNMCPKSLNTVACVAFSRTKSFLVSASPHLTTQKGPLIIWDLHNNRKEATVRCNLQDGGYTFALSCDDRYIASAKGFNIRIWDVTAQRQVRVLEGHTHFVNNIVWSPDGSYIVSSSRDSSVRVWGPNEQVTICKYACSVFRVCVCVCIFV